MVRELSNQVKKAVFAYASTNYIAVVFAVSILKYVAASNDATLLLNCLVFLIAWNNNSRTDGLTPSLSIFVLAPCLRILSDGFFITCTRSRAKHHWL